MSVEAMAWAMRADLTGRLSAEHRLVLLVLADHAASDGTGAWPGKPRIAARLGTSERSVQRALAALRAKGLIAPGDQRMVSHIRADQRPTVWTLRLGGRVDPAEPPARESAALVAVPGHGETDTSPRHGETDVAARGDSSGAHGETPVSPKPKTEPSRETPPPTPPRARALGEPCEHGQPGGAELHPKTHKPRCPLCRTCPTERMPIP